MSSCRPPPGRYLCIMRMAVLALMLTSGAAQAEPLHYAVYAGGAKLVVITTGYDVTASSYRAYINYRTTGPAAALFSGGTDTVVTGRLVGGAPRPDRLISQGMLRGEPRMTQIDYEQDTPRVVKMEPPTDVPREPVPVAAQAHTVDGLTAIVSLIQQVTTTGRCEGRTMVYDGRRLTEVTVITAGTDMLPATSRSRYAGPAMRCTITSRMVAGFLVDKDDMMRKPLQSQVWFASLKEGAAPVPVRITVPTRWFGDASVYLTD